MATAADVSFLNSFLYSGSGHIDLSFRSVYDETSKEAQDFIKEQRIRCLLQGSWFTTDRPDVSQTKPKDKPSFVSLFARLSADRRFLCYGYYSSDMELEPRMEELVHKSEFLSCILVDFYVETSS